MQKKQQKQLSFYKKRHCITIRILIDHDKIKKELFKRNSLKYYYDNKQKLNQKYVCICGGKYTYKNKRAHENSMLHQIYILNNNIIIEDYVIESLYQRYNAIDSDYE